jgi:hypothetical protein
VIDSEPSLVKEVKSEDIAEAGDVDVWTQAGWVRKT